MIDARFTIKYKRCLSLILYCKHWIGLKYKQQTAAQVSLTFDHIMTLTYVDTDTDTFLATTENDTGCCIPPDTDSDTDMFFVTIYTDTNMC